MPAPSALRRQTVEVEGEAESARAHLATVRRTLREAERRLGERLRELYVRGEPDPLAALLGAASLTEMLSTFDSLDRFAKQDRGVIAQVRRAAEGRRPRPRRSSSGARASCARSRRRRRPRESALARTAAGRRSYLARLIAERRVNQAQLAKLTAQAQSAESRNDDVSGPGSGGGESSGGGGRRRQRRRRIVRTALSASGARPSGPGRG